ncbi:MAG: nitrilase [Sulfurospirillaceae bacterium]|nr:nitrilase [Sulfurospirillaceae bacterium]
MIKIILAQVAPKLKKICVKDFEAMVANGRKDADLLVFPELCINGYLLKDAVFEDAYSLEEVEFFAKTSIGVDVVFGCALRLGHKIFNSSIYCCDGKVAHIHHKSALPNYGLFQEARFFFKGDSISPFETRFGTTMMVICEEMFDSSIIHALASVKPDLVLVIANSPARGFGENGLMIESQWQSLLSSSAILSGSHVAFVNRVGFEDGLGFWGGSRVLNPKGEVTCKAKLFEEEFLDCVVDKQLSRAQKYMLRLN